MPEFNVLNGKQRTALAMDLLLHRVKYYLKPFLDTARCWARYIRNYPEHSDGNWLIGVRNLLNAS
jgi:hypothetical protein